MAQTGDAAEHCYRRRCRRVAADDRLGRGNRRDLDRAGCVVSDHLLLDAAALLGPVALPRRGLRARRCADAPGGRRTRRDAPTNPALYAPPFAAWCGAMVA